MANQYKSPFDSVDWSDMQKQFMDALTGNKNPFAMPGSNFSSGTSWADAMDHWWSAFKPQGIGNDNVLNKMMEQCRSYYLLSQQFSEIYQTMQKAQQGSEDFVHFLNEQFQNLENLFAENNQLFNWTSFVDQCEQPVELLRSFMSSTPLYTGDVFNELSPEMKRVREQFLSVPGVGYSRETQEKMQEALRLWAIYQDNYQEFHSVMARLNHDALGLMRKRLVKMHKEGESVESMRQIYNIWVDSNEQVYGEFVFTEEYAELNSRLVNSLMAYKNKSHEITEDYLRTMNLPTSSSIEALERRQYELRKQVRVLEAELKSVKADLSQKSTAQTAPEVSTSKPATAKKDKASKPTTKPKSKAKKKAAKKRKSKAKASNAGNSSQVVDLKKSRLEKQKKKEAEAARKKAGKSDDKKDADTGGMIEIKF